MDDLEFQKWLHQVQASKLSSGIAEKGKARSTFVLREHKDRITFLQTPSEETEPEVCPRWGRKQGVLVRQGTMGAALGLPALFTAWNSSLFSPVSVVSISIPDLIVCQAFIFKSGIKMGPELKGGSWAISIFERKPTGLWLFCGAEGTLPCSSR